MGFIYKITNKINDKIYIGQTSGTIEKRFKEHIKQSRYNDTFHLYRAMRKYGIENFEVEEIEECEDMILSQREKYYIEYFDSYKNGYNMTIGGDGVIKYDYKEIANKYLELGCEKYVAEYFNCSPSVVQKACQKYNIEIKKGIPKIYWDSEKGIERKKQLCQWSKEYNADKIISKETRRRMSEAQKGRFKGENSPMYGKSFTEEHKQKLVENSGIAKPVRCIETGEIFSSALQASKKVGLKSSAGISKCCSGERRTAGKLHWEFVKGDKQ